jgi:hypothetical protein
VRPRPNVIPDGFPNTGVVQLAECTGILGICLTIDVAPHISSRSGSALHHDNMMYTDSLIRYLRDRGS